MKEESAHTMNPQQKAGAAMAVHHMSWQVKESFVEYVQQMPDGKITCKDGAIFSEDGEFQFPFSGGDDGFSPGGKFQLRFAGEVNFTAHAGMLAVQVKNPWIVADAGRAELTIVDPMDDSQRIPFAELSHRAEAAMESVVTFPAAVGVFAAEILGRVYSVGSEMAPLRVHRSA